MAAEAGRSRGEWSFILFRSLTSEGIGDRCFTLGFASDPPPHSFVLNRSVQASFRSILKAGSPTPELLSKAITDVIPHALTPPATPAEKTSVDKSAGEDGETQTIRSCRAKPFGVFSFLAPSVQPRCCVRLYAPSVNSVPATAASEYYCAAPHLITSLSPRCTVITRALLKTLHLCCPNV